MGFNPNEPTQPGEAGAPATGGGDIWGALIGAGTAIYTTIEQKKAQERQNKANRELAKYQFDLNQQAWNAQNAYNDPSSQIGRMQAAGLNPALMYGSGSGSAAGNASDYPKYQAPRQELEFAPITQTLPQVLSAYQEFRMRQAQIDNVRAQTANVNARTASEALRPGLIGTQSEAARAHLEQFQYTAPYQAAIVGNQARSSEAKLQQEWQRVSLMNQQGQQNELQQQLTKKNIQGAQAINELRASQLIFQEYRNDWMKAGVTSSDNPALRLFVRQLAEAGILDTFSSQMAEHGYKKRNR